MLLPRRHPAPDELAAARLASLRPAPRRADSAWVPTLDERLSLGAAPTGSVAGPSSEAPLTAPTEPALPVASVAPTAPSAPILPIASVVPAEPLVPTAPTAVPSDEGGWVPPVPLPSWVAPPSPEPVAPPLPVDRVASPAPADEAGRPPAHARTAAPPARSLADRLDPSSSHPARSWSYTSEGGGTLEQDTTPSDPTLWDRLRGGRFDPGRGGAAALALVAVVAIAITAFVVLRGRPQAVEASAVVTSGRPIASASGDPAAQPAPGAVVVVAVSGAVRRPGVVRLPAGSRVDDAIRAAGGALRPKDLALVNLARKVVDGEQVIVGAAAAPAAAGGGGAGAPGSPLDLNQATADQLDALPGIGPVLAEKIVAYRTEHGSFASVDQLREVSGIGESRYADLKTLVRV